MVTVPARRLAGWVERFGERHGSVDAAPSGEGFRLTAGDGATAVAVAAAPPWPLVDADGPLVDADGPGGGGPDVRAGGVQPSAADLAADLAGRLLAERDVALLVIRRGGYAAARLRGAAVVASKVGSRYVQGRTAAGGWSQQRFARRRDNQTAELVGAAVEVAARLLPAGSVPAQVLVTGGDRALVDRALADPRLRQVAGLPRGTHLALGDPRADVVASVPQLLTTVRITLTGPP